MTLARTPPGRQRRRLLLGACSALAAAVLPSALRAAPALLPAPASLLAALQAALARRRALVLMVSLHGCPFCKIVRQNYLAPLRAEGQPVVQIDMNDATPLIDLLGTASTHAEVIRALQVTVAPTVLFLGGGGREVAPRLVGISSADFYGAYLQDRVDAANRAAA